MGVLFVCTGNICRSPVAEQLLHAWARQQLGADAAGLPVDSAGTAATDGRPMDERSRRALRELGGDLGRARARRLLAGGTATAGLVLTMTRDQRATVLHTDPRSLRRVFTLPEAAALLPLADRTGFKLLPVGERAGELAVRLHAARPYRPGSAEDDVQDPIDRPLRVHREVAARIAAALHPLAAVLLTSARTPPRPRRPTTAWG